MRPPVLQRYQLTEAVTALRLRHTVETPSGRILHARVYPRDMRVVDRPAVRVRASSFRGEDGKKSRFPGALDQVTILLDWSEALPVITDEND